MIDQPNTAESIFASAEIVLFGHEMSDLALVKEGLGNNGLTKKDEQFARIFGFSFDGAYHEIPTPVLFLVKGHSKPAKDVDVIGPNPRDKKFFESLKAWTVKQTDETVRMDVDQGKFETMLLDIGTEGARGVSGARVSGARVSGARVSGARVSGARVSGARISGARGDASD